MLEQAQDQDQEPERLLTNSIVLMALNGSVLSVSFEVCKLDCAVDYSDGPRRD